MKLVSTILFHLVCVLTSIAQVNTPKETKNFRLVLSKPSAYISFERYGPMTPSRAGESESKVWLRFHNNTTWNLTVKVNGCRPEQEECIAFYEVRRMPGYKDRIKDAEIPSGHWAEVSSARTVKSGGSFLFSVPRESLAEGLYIAVDFSYEWEAFGNSGGGVLEVMHQASFLSSGLPKAP